MWSQRSRGYCRGLPARGNEVSAYINPFLEQARRWPIMHFSVARQPSIVKCQSNKDQKLRTVYLLDTGWNSASFYFFFFFLL